MENYFICNGFVFIAWEYQVVGETYVLQNCTICRVSENPRELLSNSMDLNRKNEVVIPISGTIKIEWH